MTDLYLQSDGRDMTVWHDDEPLLTEHQAGPVLWAHLVATLPTRDEPQPEPLDPGVRVREVYGDELARCSVDGVWSWTSPGHDGISWAELRHARGPLTSITPAPEPTPDERPFKVGERVRVSDDARWVCGVVHGQTVRITSVHEHPIWPSVTVALASGTTQMVHPGDLTHADADGPC